MCSREQREPIERERERDGEAGEAGVGAGGVAGWWRPARPFVSRTGHSSRPGNVQDLSDKNNYATKYILSPALCDTWTPLDIFTF